MAFLQEQEPGWLEGLRRGSGTEKDACADTDNTDSITGTDCADGADSADSAESVSTCPRTNTDRGKVNAGATVKSNSSKSDEQTPNEDTTNNDRNSGNINHSNNDHTSDNNTNEWTSSSACMHTDAGSNGTARTDKTGAAQVSTRTGIGARMNAQVLAATEAHAEHVQNSLMQLHGYVHNGD